MRTAGILAKSAIVAYLLGCASTGSVCGCYTDTCRDTATCETAGPTCAEDPLSGSATDDCGVFVSASLGDDENPGTAERPVRTHKQAIALATAGPMRVYACAERFDEAVTLPAGVSVWGALDCAHDWRYLGGDSLTALAPGAGLVPLRLDAGEGISRVFDLRLEAADAAEPGASSIAMVPASGAMAEMVRCELVAGDGADGADGAGFLEAALGGAPGESGDAACSGEPVAGAASVSTTCGGVLSVGGRGGDGSAIGGGRGNDGQPEPVDNPMGWGLGGDGQSGGIQCHSGQSGLNGGDGEHGLGARGEGAHITAAGGWQGVAGQDGGDGRPGQGGGGGGGSRGGALYCGAGPKGGASGGSGGSGGCGGLGGKGGGYGGASLGLVALSGDVTLSSTSIVTGKGGDGGVGGLAQFGGAEGVPGLGGASVGGSPSGCAGGWGGRGGNGGYGGGGLGGASLGIAHLIGQPPSQKDVSITTGNPGKGGLGGNQYVPGSVGEDGVRADTMGFPR